MSLTAREEFLLKAAIITAFGWWIYLPVLNGDWLWDDPVVVSENPELRTWSGLGQIWFSAPATDYWPITWTLLWIEWHLWGGVTLGYHVTNVLFHLTGAFLIWRLLSKLGLSWGWLGALIFTVHPLAVESVAWISEIKNTFSLPFYLLSLIFYIDADRDGKADAYWKSLFFYLFAMLCKTSVVMLPAVLLLYCWWRHGRLTGRDVGAMLPYFAIALALGSLTYYFQTVHFDEQAVVRERTFVIKLIGASSAIVFYLGKFITPVDQMLIYPRWNLHPPSLLRIATLPLVAVMLVALWAGRKTWGRHALLGIGFFLINLFPIIGLMQMNWMNVSWVADHLAYIPIIGLIGLVVAGVEQASRMRPGCRPILVAAIVAVIIPLALKSHWYAGQFVDLKTLRTTKIHQMWD
ncbi:MAG: hypothetical protein LV479_05045 [Methylacidiphilales bacterium]|nr:hypothetical protein [Candidatus Methylacidiphilales bacterium]